MLQGHALPPLPGTPRRAAFAPLIPRRAVVAAAGAGRWLVTLGKITAAWVAAGLCLLFSLPALGLLVLGAWVAFVFVAPVMVLLALGR